MVLFFNTRLETQFCYGYRYFHLHVGTYPNLFQVRLMFPTWPWITVTRADSR